MGEKIIFDYFYGQESEMHAFYRVPKLLFTNAHFKKLSSDAKILRQGLRTAHPAHRSAADGGQDQRRLSAVAGPAPA